MSRRRNKYRKLEHNYLGKHNALPYYVVFRELSKILETRTIREVALGMNIDEKRIRVILSGYENSKKRTKIEWVSLDWTERMMISVGKTIHDVDEYWSMRQE